VVEVRVAEAAADPVADRVMAELAPDPEQVRVQDQDHRQDRDQAQAKDRGPVRVMDPVVEKASALVAKVIIRVTDLAMVPAMMARVLRTAQATGQVPRVIMRVKYDCESS
jgi:hypothetical protein